MSLEASIYGKTDKQTFKDFIRKLPAERQEEIVKEYLVSEFRSEWLTYFSNKTLQNILDRLVSDSDISGHGISTRPTTLLDLFEQL